MVSLSRKGSSLRILNSFTVRRAPYADRIVVLNGKGQISHNDTFQNLNGQLENLSGLFMTEAARVHSHKHKTATTDTSVESAPAAVRAALPKSELEESLTRQTGDRAVYKYYIKSAGSKAVITFVLALTVYAFCDAFPC